MSSFLVAAFIPASDVGTAGTYDVTVYDPDCDLESDPVTFTVVPALDYTYLPAIRR